MARVRQRALNFGSSGALVGILTTPETGGPPDNVRDTAVVFLNAGVIHRVGPNRLHVCLANALAAAGIPALRMDFPGLGDSGSPETARSVAEESQAAIRSAFAFLEHLNVAHHFILFGLCKGADYGFAAATVDPRVVGLFLIDPTGAFPTWKSWTLRTLRWLARPSGWLRLLRGRYGVLGRVRRLARSLRSRERTAAAHDAGPAAKGAEASAGSMKEAVAEALRALVVRRVQVGCVYTGDRRHEYAYSRQLLDAFPGLGLDDFARTRIFRRAQHTFPREASRVMLEETFLDWIRTVPFCGSAPSTGVSEAGPDPSAEPVSLRAARAASGGAGRRAPGRVGSPVPSVRFGEAGKT